MPAPTPSRPAGYLFAYFSGEQQRDGERVRFALSDGPGLTGWRELTGIPPLAPDGGGARDPFLIRGADGDYRLLATDLRIHGGTGWPTAITHGSRSLLVWSSPDLLRWDGPRRAEVMPESAGCVWAPEAVHLPERDEYLVFWASTLYADHDPGHQEPSYQRMCCATTRDFVEFGTPRVWLDKGYPVIDSTVVEHDGWYYRFTKDERPTGSPGAPGAKFVFVERSRELASDDYELVAEGVGQDTHDVRGLRHAEGPIVLPAPDGRGWVLLLDEFGLRGYLALWAERLDGPTWTPVADPDGGSLPAGLRHGSVLALTREEFGLLDDFAATGGRPAANR